jgi:hypothetical protein
MKKSIVIFFLFSLLSQASDAQVIDSISRYIRTKEKMLIKAFEHEAKTICDQENATFIGNTRIKSGGFEFPKYYFITGLTEYENKSCGIVKCEYKAKLIVYNDELVCFYLKMPTCILKTHVLYSKKYSVNKEDDCE